MRENKLAFRNGGIYPWEYQFIGQGHREENNSLTSQPRTFTRELALECDWGHRGVHDVGFTI